MSNYSQIMGDVSEIGSASHQIEEICRRALYSETFDPCECEEAWAALAKIDALSARIKQELLDQ